MCMLHLSPTCLPSLTQCLQEEALSRHQQLGNAKLISIRPPDDEDDLQSRSPLMSPGGSQQQSPQHCSLNNTPVHPPPMASLASHSPILLSTSTSCSPSPRVIYENIASAAHTEPQPHFTVEPSECLGTQAGPSSPVNGLNLDHSWVATSTTQCNVCRVEHKIHGLNQVMHWFDSHGCKPLLSPLPCEALECRDLYIHQSLSTPTIHQMWIWTAQRCWEVVKENHVHPILPMHCLWLGVTGEPCWVTQKMISTYKGCLKVSGKLNVVIVQANSKAFCCFLSIPNLTYKISHLWYTNINHQCRHVILFYLSPTASSHNLGLD
jgi:hypothetical protein